MKTACSLFLMMSCAALAPNTSLAASAQQSSTKSSLTRDSARSQDARQFSDDRRVRGATSVQNHPRRPTNTINVHPKQLPNNREHFQSKNSTKFLRPGSGKSAGAAKGGVVQRETTHKTGLVRPASGSRPTAPSFDNVRHRGANPAVIGGSANSTRRNAGAISGTSVHRRP